MEPIKSGDLVSRLNTYRRNPNGIQRAVYGLLRQASAGRLNVIDPSNPLSLLLEAGAVMSSDAINECEALTRRMYPKLVTNEEELYGHIADMEYVGVWGSPSTDTFVFMFNLDEIKAAAKPVPGTTNRRLTIPRETKVTVAGTDFSFAYPINIIIAASGTVSVLYDTTQSSPFMALESNVIEFRTANLEGQNVLMFEVTGMQYSVTSSIATLSSITGFTTTLAVPNRLYYCRVYHRSAGGTWAEMATSHSGRVYDASVPTATLKYADSRLRVRIPEVYFNSGLMGTELRIDVYSTRGDVNMAVGDYPYNAVQVQWNDLNNEDNGLYTAPLSQLTNVAIAGTGVTRGGANGLTFNQLRTRTVRNSTYKPVPVTELDLNNSLTDLGFDLLTVVDNVTDRTFIASRAMPAPTSGLSSSPIGTNVESVRLTDTILNRMETVKRSNKVWSIMPNTLYRRDGEGIAVVSDLVRRRLTEAVGDELISLLSQEKYYFSPYLTVLDTNDDKFVYNNYHIDAPRVDRRYFGGSNSRVDYGAAISTAAIYRTASGYELSVAVTGSSGHENLAPAKAGLQLGFKPDGSQQRCYIEGVNHGRDSNGRIVFRFPIDTDFEVLRGHELQIKNFKMVASDTLHYPVTPDTVFDFIHYVTDVGLDVGRRDNMHELLGRVTAPDDAVVITHETANIRMFERLTGLINRSRVSISSPTYETWENDVPALYTEDVYRREADTGFIELIEQDGTFVPTLLHREGSPVMQDGKPVLKHRAGDRKLGLDGQPIVIGSNGIAYFIDQVLLDARYLFATETGTTAYLSTIASTVVNWVKNDIGRISKNLLPRTDLLFSPKTNSGTLTVHSVQGEPRRINAEISVKVDLYVNYNAYSNTAVRTSISNSVRSVVISELAKSRISTGSIHDNLRALVSEDVITIKVHSFNDSSNLDAFIVANDSIGCSLAKLLRRQPDGSIALVDDLEINFIRHTS